MGKKNVKAITIAVMALIPVFFGSKFFKSLGMSSGDLGSSSIEALYENRQSGVMVKFGEL